MSTGELSDAEFLAAIEATTYPGEKFGHRGHLRLGWLCLREHGFEAGLERIRTLVRNYATALGAAQKFHETMTRAWAERMQAALDETPGHRLVRCLPHGAPGAAGLEDAGAPLPEGDAGLAGGEGGLGAAGSGAAATPEAGEPVKSPGRPALRAVAVASERWLWSMWGTHDSRPVVVAALRPAHGLSDDADGDAHRAE